MQFTGKNLVILRDALELAKDELHNQIATCPDVVEYAEDIAVYRAEQVKVQRLLGRINRCLENT